jgi:hypothetical protein
MSYCRWSSDNYKCDIYAYESSAGYQIHVASSRYVGEPPESSLNLIILGGKENIDKYLSGEKVRRKWFDKGETRPIGLPYDGESYLCDSLQEFYDKMMELRNAGYHIPDQAFKRIKEEMNPTPH